MADIARAAALVLAYIVIGRLDLLLAIPPGFATAVFPPVGIAIGVVSLYGLRLLPAVFLGSLLLNLWVGLADGKAIGVEAMLTASGIALGSVVSVGIAAVAIRKILGARPAFTRERDTAVIYLVAGPVACSFSGLFCPWVLLQTGVIHGADYGYTSWTWWVGDSIGVLLALPIVYTLFARPRSVWRPRLVSVALPLFVTCMLMVLVFVRINRADMEKIEQAFNMLSMPFASGFEARLRSQESVLKSIDSLFQASEDVREKDFVRFTENALADNPEIYALSWNDYILASEREQAETDLSQRGFTTGITERNERGELIRAGARRDYVFVKYIAPFNGNEKAQNFDVGSRPDRRGAFTEAAERNRPAITPPIQLVQDTVRRKALLMFYPVYRDEAGERSLTNIEGFATGVLVMQQMLERMLSSYPQSDGLRVEVHYLGEHSEQIAQVGQPESSRMAPLIGLARDYHFAGRQLRLSIEPTPAFVARHHNLHSWTVLSGGFLFCALLGGFLLSISARAERVKDLVDERTRELSSILNSATDAILTLDPDGYIQRVNRAALSLFMTDEDTLKHSRIDRWLPECVRDDQTIEQWWSSAVDRVFDTALVTAEHQRLAVELGVSRVDFHDQYYFVLMLHDITERKKTERLKSEFISTVSHELRTPLTSITGSLKLLEAGVAGDLSAEVKRLLGIARSNSERLNALVNDILDVEKLDYDQFQIDLQSVNLRELIMAVVQQMKHYADGYGVTIEPVFDSSIDKRESVMADRDRLMQVVFNLLSNAIKYSHPQATVWVRVWAEEEELAIAVKDTGRGMPEYFRKHIFQRFSQADSSDSREKSGTGLGLYITKSLVERMHGRIDYTSALGSGTEFVVHLPAAE